MNPTTPPRAPSQTRLFNADASERLWHFGALLLIRLAGPDTSESLTVVESLAPKGHGAPLHRHSRESETLVLLDGDLTVFHDDQHLDIAESGAILHFPVLAPHGFMVRSETAHMYSIFNPAGFESFFRALSTPASSSALPEPPDQPPDIDLVRRIARECGCELLSGPVSSAE
jgi:quercetin dioxygenase-like cupin family protein